MLKKKIIIKGFSPYSESVKPFWIKEQEMTLKEFQEYIRGWEVQEFKEQDLYRTDNLKGYSWKGGFINTLID